MSRSIGDLDATEARAHARSRARARAALRRAPRSPHAFATARAAHAPLPRAAAQVGVVPTPDVRTHMLEPRDQFVILASDGVWEFIESDEAVQIVGGIYAKGWSAEAACKHLIARAAVAWMEEEGNHRDDITCIVVYLSCRDEMLGEHWHDYGIDDDDSLP